MTWADRSPREQAALRYCAPLGIPLSEVMGRTFYPGEPRWLPDDLEGVFDWQAGVCSGCGQDTAETIGPGHQDKWNAEMSGHCDGCRALRRAALIAADNDAPVEATVGARFRMWRDEEGTDGRL